MRLYLHLRDQERFVEDPDGAVFSSLADARREAVLAAREMLAERLRSGRWLAGDRFEICDSDGNLRLVVPFEDAIPNSDRSGG